MCFLENMYEIGGIPVQFGGIPTPVGGIAEGDDPAMKKVGTPGPE
ncbi:hypothetical protein ACFVSW_07000 [Neobacillus sp. NPDC058068]